MTFLLDDDVDHCPIPAELDKSYSLEFPGNTKLVFKGKTLSYPSAGHTEQAKEYAIDLELFGEVVGDKAKTSLTGKSLVVTVPKKGEKDLHFQDVSKGPVRLTQRGDVFRATRAQAGVLAETEQGQGKVGFRKDW